MYVTVSMWFADAEDLQIPVGRKVTEDDLSRLEETNAALSWKTIGRKLYRNDKNQKMHAFTESSLEEISEKCNRNSRECLRAIIVRWQDMSGRHTSAQLIKALREANLGGIADEVFPE